jgi:hypothetical protein
MQKNIFRKMRYAKKARKMNYEEKWGMQKEQENEVCRKGYAKIQAPIRPLRYAEKWSMPKKNEVCWKRYEEKWGMQREQENEVCRKRYAKTHTLNQPPRYAQQWGMQKKILRKMRYAKKAEKWVMLQIKVGRKMKYAKNPKNKMRGMEK